MFASSVSAELLYAECFSPIMFDLSISAQLDCSECFNPIKDSLHTIIIISLLFSSFNDALSISRGDVHRKNWEDKCDQRFLCLYRK